MRTFPSPSPAPPTAACRRRTACGSPQLVSTPRPRWPVLTRRRMAGFEVSTEGRRVGDVGQLGKKLGLSRGFDGITLDFAPRKNATSFWDGMHLGGFGGGMHVG